MSGYIPNTTAEQMEMLESIGMKDFEELFQSVPEAVRFRGKLDLPSPLSEPELLKHMNLLASEDIDTSRYTIFLGAGSYDHFIPSAVRHIISRSEFYTAYTPYQPEISQGTLQAIFEYQTMICELTGMDVSNASMYDGATALAEAAFMAAEATGRKKIIVSRTVHPEHRAVIKTYSKFKGLEVEEIGFFNGQTDLEKLKRCLNDEAAAVIIQNPNFFGNIEDITSIGEIAHNNKSLFIVSPDPISLAVLKSPGEAGADIAAGEGQPLGGPLNFGGPTFGFLAARKELLRKMPGRITGETADRNGKRCFVLTIQAREQHIRREKATSNICSNQALNALAAAVYLSMMGKSGLREAAGLCINKSHYAYQSLISTGKFKPLFTAPFFKEFALESKIPVSELNEKLLKQNILGGYDLSGEYPEIAGGYLLAVTEKRTKAEIDKLVEVVSMINE